jgi:hypothetical protein
MIRRLSRCEQLAWCAGLIDGEGSIGLNYESYNVARLHVRLRCQMTSLSAIERLREVLGAGTVTKQVRKPPRQPAYAWYLQQPTAAIRVLEQLLPHLVVKRYEAQIALAFLKNPHLSREQKHVLHEECTRFKQRPRRNRKLGRKS